MPLQFSGVSELARTFGVLPAEMKVALKPAVLGAAQLIADKAKENAGFSSRLPGQVKAAARLSGVGGAEVRVVEGVYPHVHQARVLEGNGESPTPFRHPVYGNEAVWRVQMTHPFLGPAVEEVEPAAVAIIAEAVASVAHAHGL